MNKQIPTFRAGGPCELIPSKPAKDPHKKDFMAMAEPTKCALSFLNSLSSRTIRAAFFAMFRKGPSVALDTCFRLHFMLSIYY